MTTLAAHPTVLAVQEAGDRAHADWIDGAELRRWMLDAGADDVGFVAIDRAELNDQRDDILAAFPQTQTLISFVCRMNRGPIRSTARSVANLEFHHTGERVNEVAREIVRKLEDRGYEAVNPSMGFPMEMDRFPEKPWVVSHKPVAVAAGLGQMGIHRNVIHPKFGNFILLGTVLLGAKVGRPELEMAGSNDRERDESKPLDFNPCLGCKLCVAACPVGAITPDGSFNFSACYTHNYREFMGGFVDWAERAIGETDDRGATPTTDSESVSMWQSLSFGPNYKAAYCLAVCPAGEDVISPFLNNRGQFVADQLKPLQAKEEPVYVQPGSDAEEYVQKRFPHKEVRRTGLVLRLNSVRQFIMLMQHSFQPGKSKGLDAVYHFRFYGSEEASCTVTIRDQKIEVRDGHVGECDLKVTANATQWVRFLRKETPIAWLIATLRVRMWGDPRLLARFGKCFP